MRVVLDTHVFISAVLSSRGAPAQILRAWEKQDLDIELVVSLAILDELERVIHYPRIQEKYGLSAEYVDQFLKLLSSSATLVDASVELAVIKEDPSDNRYLECAVAAEASYIVTGDAHLLRLKEYRGIVILRPAEFLAVAQFEE